MRQAAAELAGQGVFIGTSSWKYEGWLGQLYSSARYEYRGQVAKTRFERDCLNEYAEGFKTVCVDSAYEALAIRRGNEEQILASTRILRLPFAPRDHASFQFVGCHAPGGRADGAPRRSNKPGTDRSPVSAEARHELRGGSQRLQAVRPC